MMVEKSSIEQLCIRRYAHMDHVDHQSIACVLGTPYVAAAAAVRSERWDTLWISLEALRPHKTYNAAAACAERWFSFFDHSVTLSSLSSLVVTKYRASIGWKMMHGWAVRGWGDGVLGWCITSHTIRSTTNTIRPSDSDRTTAYSRSTIHRSYHASDKSVTDKHNIYSELLISTNASAKMYINKLSMKFDMRYFCQSRLHQWFVY